MKTVLVVGLITLASVVAKAESVLCIGQTQNHKVDLKVTRNTNDTNTAKYEVVMTDKDPRFPTLEASFDLPVLEDGQTASVSNVAPFYMVSLTRKGNQLELAWIDQNMDGYFTGSLICSK